MFYASHSDSSYAFYDKTKTWEKLLLQVEDIKIFIKGGWGVRDGTALTRVCIDSLNSYLILKDPCVGGGDGSDYRAAGDNLTY